MTRWRGPLEAIESWYGLPKNTMRELTNQKQEDRLQQLEEKMELMLEGSMCGWLLFLDSI